MSFNDFSLIPADDPQSSPQEDIDAAEEGALALADSVQPIEPDPVTPLGRSWRFDWMSGQFARMGQSPAEVTGLDALAEWCEMAIHTARYSSPILSDDFGMEKPDGLIGGLVDDEAIADWQAALVDALLVHDRIASVENIGLEWDPTVGVLYVRRLDVITDEDQTVTVSDVALQIGG